eukprot:Rhum_TRINITY_DN13198_c0_g1::Rhum_TRINITY_DN13198_c0_g1_i1::g.57772::m.57772
MPPAARELGVVFAWVHNKGFGFIRPFNANLGRKLFVHRTEVRNIQGTLRLREIVEFTPAWREAEEGGEEEGNRSAGFGGTHCEAKNVTGRGGVAPVPDDADAMDLTGRITL